MGDKGAVQRQQQDLQNVTITSEIIGQITAQIIAQITAQLMVKITASIITQLTIEVTATKAVEITVENDCRKSCKNLKQILQMAIAI